MAHLNEKIRISQRSSIERLNFCNFKLDTLLDITLAINENMSTDNLLSKYQQILQERLKIGKIQVFLKKKNDWNLIIKAGVSEIEEENLVSINDLTEFQEISTVTYSENPNLKSYDVVIPVFHNINPLAYVLIGDIDEESEGIAPTLRHLHFIQTFTNIIVVAIENKRLFKENVEQERLKKELELASRMQEMLIPNPERFPKSKYFSIESFYLPHYEVSGDYFDVKMLDENTLGFCIADVSGKGISAALLMSNFQANMKALFTSDISLSLLVSKLNDRVNDAAQGEKFITLFVGKYFLQTKELIYVNAGHLPMLLYNSVEKNLFYLKDGCVGMGMLDEIPVVREGKISITNTSKLLCFTDGIAELEFENEIDSGVEKIIECISTSCSIKETVAELIEKMNINKNNSAIFDDITMLGIEFL